MEGVLKSWAIPKGPSLDPADKRLAMQTEDHPVEYGDFEGVIPEGEYGGGTVIVWDRGTWEPVGDPHQGLHGGNLKFALHGERLRGRFALVKIRGRDARDSEKSWLLIKEKDAEARPGYDVVARHQDSVVTGRTLDQVAADRDRVWHSNRDAADRVSAAVAARRSTRPAARTETRRTAAPDPKSAPGARRAALPEFLAPQLATLVSEAPPGEEWLHEMKFDGYRILCRLQRGRARLLSRNGKDWTDRLPAVAEAAERLPASQALLDGEAAVLLPNGTTSFQALQNLMSGTGSGHLVYYVFDLLHLDGYDLAGVALESRKDVLRALLEAADVPSPLRYSEHVRGSGPDFYAQACQLSLEGVVCKRRDAVYRSGRSRDWLKVKCLEEQEVVIGGFTPPRGSRVGVGALLVGFYDDRGRLRYAGKVGTGFTDATLRDLERRLTRLEQPEPPFEERPPGASKARWVRPELVAEVSFTEWTSDGRLRHPSFQGLREDKRPRDVVRETPRPVEDVTKPPPPADEAPARASARRTAPKPGKRPIPAPPPRAPGGEVHVAGVRLTHPDRVLYPPQGTTKRDLALFYESIADWILPHLKGRPTTLVRCPEGAHKGCFYQKHTGVWAPETLRRVKIQEAKKVGEYLVVDDLPGLIGLVQIGILEIHTWNAVADRLEQPDRLVFDLDPDPSVSWERVIEAAHRVRDRLAELGLASFLKTTGGKGLHVVVPLQRGPGWEGTGGFAEAVANDIANEDPGSYTAVMSKAKRKGKIFIDYLRNYRGATSVAAYSTRAKLDAPVSVPLRWDELTPALKSDHFTLANLPQRFESLEADPWADYWKTRQRLTASQRKAVGLR
jgi:bifunctional non-homologous end joining protein LigD